LSVWSIQTTTRYDMAGLNNKRLKERKSISQDKGEQEVPVGLTPKVVVISVVLMFLIALMVSRADIAKTMSGINVSGVPSPAAILVVLLLMGVSELLRKKKVLRAMRLNRGELLLLYIIISVGGLIASIPLVGIFPFTIMSIRYSAAVEPSFWVKYSDIIPSFVIPTSDAALEGFFLGDAKVPWGEWIFPLIMWGMFYGAILFVFICMASLVRERWVEHERLIFPLNLPILAMVEHESGDENVSYFGSFWRNKFMWIGAAIPAVISGLAILHRYYPVIPQIPGKIELGKYFTEEPFKSGLNAIPALDLYVNPLTVGIGYFLSLDLTFTFLLTYLIGQMGSRVVGMAYGNAYYGTHFQYLHGSGTWMAIAFMLLWMSRGTVKEIILRAVGRESESAKVKESNLPMTYNTAFFGGILAFLFIIIFSIQFLGYTAGWAVLFWVVFFMFAFIFARMRAESGLPTNDATVPEFKMNVAWAYGTDKIASSAIPMTFGHVLNYYQSLIAYTLEGYKLADEGKIKRKSIVGAIFLAALLAWVFGNFVLLPLIYEKGAFAMDSYVYSHPKNNFASGAWAVNSTDTGSLYAQVFLYTGLAVGFFLMIMRTRFIWWPIHPIGYAGVWQTGVGWSIWGPFFLVWLIKALVLRYGGNSLYQRLKPIFLGMVVGSVLMSVVGSVTNIKVVYVDRIPKDVDMLPIISVGIDNFRAACQATEYLIELGHKRISCVTGRLNSAIAIERVEGYKKALLDNGLQIDDDLIIEGDFSLKSGASAASFLLNMRTRPSAVFASNDTMAIGMLKEFERRRVMIPKELSIVGFDGTPISEYTSPSLTTILQPVYEMGVTAARLLFESIENDKDIGSRHELDVKLVIRESTDYVSRDDS
jgi:hypothetical protein